jgi:hypothetical protein
MIGAGMSLNAVARQSDAPRFMLWRDLLQMFERQLGYRTSAGRGVSDALRLASEFESAFGPTALENLLKDAAPDDHYDPGAPHELLLSLPWVDVFTTNYDRLLERAVPQTPETRYSLIKNVADIPTASRPRIVKLHGSFPSDRPFIITEEHYRTYRRQFAPFVNLVQQAVMETTFCLVGFSGDDPNFLQWAGWVRDELGNAAPPIYLCGVLDLSEQQQHILRTRRIIPIDLSNRFSRRDYPNPDLRHAHALEWFLLSLAAGAPKDVSRWPEPAHAVRLVGNSNTPPSLDDAPDARTPLVRWGIGTALELRDVVNTCVWWRSEREAYPGWITMPETNREHLWSETSRSISDGRDEQWATALARLPAPYALLCWYELAWRLERSLMPLTHVQADAITASLNAINPYPHLLADLALAPFVSGDALTPPEGWPENQRPNWDTLADTWVDLAFMILRNARERFDNGAFELWVERAARFAVLRPRWASRLAYERALRCIFLLQAHEAHQILTAPTAIQSPFEEGRRAALLAELGDIDTARRSVERALASIQSDATARSTLRTSSEEGWLLWLASLLDDDDRHRERLRDRQAERRRRLERLGHLGCNPRAQSGDRAQQLRDSSLRDFEQSIPDEGFYSDPPADAQLRFEEPHAWFLVRGFEMGSVFVRAPPVRVFPDELEKAAQALFSAEPKYALTLMLRIGQRSVVERAFDRVTIALLSDDLVNHAFELCASALIAEMRSAGPRFRRGLKSNVVIPACELVSRLWFRLRGPQPSRARQLAQDLYCHAIASPHDWELPQSVRFMFRSAFGAMTPADVSAWVPSLLELPLPPSDTTRRVELADPFNEMRTIPDVAVPPVVRTATITEAVAALLRVARGRGPDRSKAVHRLDQLHRLAVLDDRETREFADALWGQIQSNSLPDIDGYRFPAFMKLPAPESIDRMLVLRNALLAEDIPPILTSDGTNRTSSDLVQNATSYFIGFEYASMPLLRFHTHQFGIPWSISEYGFIVNRLSAWMDANLNDHNRMHEIAEPAIRSLCNVLAHVVVPGATADQLLILRVADLLRNVGSGMIPLHARAVDLIAGRVTVAQLQEALLMPYFSPQAEDDDLLAAGDGILLWLAFVSAGIAEAPGQELIRELLTSMIGRRNTTLGRRIEITYTVVRFFPERLNEQDLVLLEGALRALLAASALPTSIRTEPAARAATRGTAQVRAAASRLASELYGLYIRNQQRVPSILRTWQGLAENDVLPEVRHAWNPRLS